MCRIFTACRPTPTARSDLHQRQLGGHAERLHLPVPARRRELRHGDEHGDLHGRHGDGLDAHSSIAWSWRRTARGRRRRRPRTGFACHEARGSCSHRAWLPGCGRAGLRRALRRGRLSRWLRRAARRVRCASPLCPSIRSALLLAGGRRSADDDEPRHQGRPVDEQFMDEAVALRKQGKKQEEIAAELGVAQGTISSILRKRGFGGGLSDNPDGP